MKFRFAILTTFFILAFGVLIVNLYHLQIAEGSWYAARAASQYRGTGILAAERGAIYFSDKFNNRIPAALNKEFSVIFAVPEQIMDPQVTAAQVATFLDLPESDLER